MDGSLVINPPHLPTYTGVDVVVSEVESQGDGMHIAHLTGIGVGIGWAVSLTEDELALLTK